MRFLALILILTLPGAVSAQTILNVETLQGDEVAGIHGQVSGRLRVDSGNTEVFQLGGDLGIGHLSPKHWIRAYLGGERQEQKGKGVLDNRYVHLRYNYIISSRLRSFHFGQLQTSRNLLLDQRRLLGSGLRYRLLGESGTRLEAGSGLMLEVERLNREKLDPEEDNESRTLRMANLLVGSGPVGEGNRWVAVVYYQPDLQAFSDYRLSAEVGLGLELISPLRLDLSLTWRHDSRAPAELESYDVSMKTAFTYAVG